MISIIIPIYNAERYLDSCIGSLVHQISYDDQIILVNDGSEDGSYDICCRYSNEYQNIILINQKNQGVIIARKSGLSKVNNPYVWFVDADDFVERDAINEIKNKIKLYEPDILWFDYLRYDKENKYKKELSHFSFDKILNKSEIRMSIIPKMLYFDGFFNFGIEPSLCNKVIKKKFLMKAYRSVQHGIFLGEDGLILYQCVMEADTIYRFDKALYIYRETIGSVTQNRERQLFEQNELLFSYWKKLMGDFIKDITNRRQFECYKMYLNWFAVEDNFIKIFMSKIHFIDKIKQLNKLKKKYKTSMDDSKMKISYWSNLTIPQFVKVFLLNRGDIISLYIIWRIGNYRSLKSK